MFDKMNKAFFEPHMNTTFNISSEQGGAALVELIQVDEQKSGTHTSLSLVFAGSKDQYLPQMIYRFEHETIEPFELFIVPIGEHEKGYAFEAIIIKEGKE